MAPTGCLMPVIECQGMNLTCKPCSNGYADEQQSETQAHSARHHGTHEKSLKRVITPLLFSHLVYDTFFLR